MSKLKKWLIAAIVFALLWFAGYLYLRLHATPWVCPRHDHVIAGQTYAIERCAGGGGDHHFFNRLRIYSTDGELLATRRFRFFLSPPVNEFEIQSDRIVYTDALVDETPDGVPEFVKHELRFPLTRWDYVSANVDRILFAP